ncbi:MAG: hypothetical protein IJY09_08330 [Lachnospiraceae bacterium]|nr:hypothetical protein [Lachnospiraceae bacterium]
MKKAGKYLTGLVMLALLFSGCYYFSYKQALRKLGAQRQEQNMNSLLAEHMTGEEQFAALNGPVEITPPVNAEDTPDATKEAERQNAEAEDTDQRADAAVQTPDNSTEAVETDTIRQAYILPDTKLLIETYEMSTGAFTIEEKVPDAVLVGMTREELMEELKKEMENMPVSEYERGLLSNELITFSEDKVIVRRTYDAERIEYLYYIAVKSGEVVVYYSDRKTVYEYTGISAATLAEEDRLALMSGIPVQTAEEMFALLESYSS